MLVARRRETSISDYFVAVCDILGFSGLVERISLEELSLSYRHLMDLAWRGAPYLPDSTAVFSDTILSWVDVAPRPRSTDMYADPRHERFVDLLCWLTFLNMLLDASILENMPLRIGVAFGQCEIDRRYDVFLGRPIVEAYRCQQAQDWIGGACHDSCNRYGDWYRIRRGSFGRIRHARGMGELIYVVDYDVPVKDGAGRLGCALNWPQFRFEDRAESEKELLERIAAATEGRAKWENTLAFFRAYHELGVVPVGPAPDEANS